jgi:hypothetical protein
MDSLISFPSLGDFQISRFSPHATNHPRSATQIDLVPERVLAPDTLPIAIAHSIQHTQPRVAVLTQPQAKYVSLHLRPVTAHGRFRPPRSPRPPARPDASLQLKLCIACSLLYANSGQHCSPRRSNHCENAPSLLIVSIHSSYGSESKTMPP